MPSAYLLSDRALQIDWSASGHSAAASHEVLPHQLALIRHGLIEEIRLLDWPACQLVQADQSITVLFEESILRGGQAQAMMAQMQQMVVQLGKNETLAKREGQQVVGHHQVVVNYGGVAGQDLAWLAGKTGLSPKEVVDLHCSATYTVQFLGFLPGFAYLTGLPQALHIPRRASPRPRVPAGTLAIGAHYCAIYPWESPGGWHLLGHVAQVLFDPDRTDSQGQSLLKAGDTVKFIQADYA